jgi:hypothetical protein
MKKYVFRIILPCTFLLFLFACEKDSEFFTEEDPVITQTSDYAIQAEGLLAQLPQEGLDILSPEDIATFRKGPNISTRSDASPYASWYPVLGMFFCDVGISNTTGEGMWIDYGLSSIELDLIPNPLAGFGDGNVMMTSEGQAKLMGPFEAKTYHKWKQGNHKQLLKATFEAGTQIFFMPNGKMNMHVLFQPDEVHPIIILVEGWVEYGLADPPVPLDFEPHFPFDVLKQHYVDLKMIPGAEAMYIETLNDFWIYPTANPEIVAAPGIGTGPWHNVGNVTMTVDQTIEGINAAGRGRFSMGTGPGYMNAQYFDICHTMTLTETGGIWPFDIVGGSEEFFNSRGQGTGVWIGLGEPPFGNVPDPLIFPQDLKDDGFVCNPYGNTDCAGFCVPGPGFPTQVYVIAYRYALDDGNCFSINQAGIAQVGPNVITLPDGRIFSGIGALPHPTQIGTYSGMFTSATISSITTPIGQFNHLIHFFDDGAGNAFWTTSLLHMTPLAPPIFNLNEKITIVGGTGDFLEARGMLRNVGELDLTTYQVEKILTGEMCL